MYDPEIETAPWEGQVGADDALYVRQIAYLLARSPFYRAKLAAAGFRDATAVGGLADIAALPLTEKDELRADAQRSRADRHLPRGADGRSGAHLFDQRHHRDAELRPADAA